MDVSIENGVLTISMPIRKEVSKSGKNLLIASTHGNHSVDAKVDDKPVTLSVNAYIPR